MRCTNCGWNNPDGLTKCQKCNQPLEMAAVPAPVAQMTRPTQNVNLTATIRDVREVMDRQPVASEPVPVNSRKATVRDIEVVLDSIEPEPSEESPVTGSLRLVPIDGNGGSISLEQNSVIGRGEINPDNSSISARQFEVKYDASGVTIKDISQYGNTYLLLKEETAVKSGDVLLIGNHRYVVE